MSARYRNAAFIALAIGGTIALAVVLLFSLRPTKKPRVLPAADIAALAPGKWLVVDSDRLRFFVLRPMTGEPYVLAAPIDNGAVLLPEVYWWKPYTVCKDFGLDTSTGSIDADSRFRCRDKDLPDEWVHRWQWDVHGKHVPHPAGKIDNLHGVTVERDGDELVFVGLEPD